MFMASKRTRASPSTATLKLRAAQQENNSLAMQLVNKDRVLDAFTDEPWRQGHAIDQSKLEEQLHLSNQNFSNYIDEYFPDLTSKERKIGALINLNLSSKEIAEVMSLSPSSIDTYRHNIRRKMGLESHESLSIALTPKA